MTTPVLIRLLGGFRLSVAGREVTSLPRKAQALLGYLAMQDGRPVTRETVSDLLWTDRGAEQARHSLRQTLLVLRRALRDAGGDVIANNPSTLAFVPGMVETDVGRFRLLARSSDRAGLAEASEIYGGSLLDRFPPVGGDFDDWLIVARSEVSDVAIDALRRLTDACLAAGDVAPAVTAAERMLSLDLLREDSHRLLMEAYLRAGRRADAIRQYDACVEVLRRELDVGPSEETEGVAAKVRQAAPSLSALGTTQPRDFTHRSITGQPRIAVLPFDLLSPEAIPIHLNDGLVADVICQLAGLRELSVISHGSTINYRSGRVDLQEVKHALDVQYVVRGSVQRSGAAVRLTTELIDISQATVLSGRTYDTQAPLSFADQDRIVSQIVNILAPRVVQNELLRIRGKRIDDLTVYEKVLLVREHLTGLGEDNFLRAKSLLDDVLAQEPLWGEAYALAADWHGLVLAEGWSGTREHHLAEIDRLSATALRLDSDNLRALTFYGHRKSLFHHDYDAALSLFQRALDVGPGSAQAWLWSSYTHTYIGDAKEAVRRAEHALSLSPRDREAHWFYSGVCMAHYTAGDYDSAVEWGRRALAEPVLWRGGAFWVAASLVGAGRDKEARDVASFASQQWPGRRVSDAVTNSPYREAWRRQQYGQHLLAAGIPA